MPLKKSRSIIKHGSLLVEAYLNDRYVGDKGDHKLTISFSHMLIVIWLSGIPGSKEWLPTPMFKLNIMTCLRKLVR